jgi:DNA-binding CsgD family transcriptional regulator
LIFTPFFFLAQGKKEWIADLSRQEVTFGDALNSFFEDWKLSKREKEVARLLLSGLTLRQIALTMSLSYATINTYQNSLYRKLGVNSRSELLLRCQAFLTPKPPH